jgi:hypothetical protein
VIDAKQTPLFELPELPVVHEDDETPAVKPRKARTKRAKQLALEVKFYTVHTPVNWFQVQAATPSAAKYVAFKIVRSIGQYNYPGGFLAFVAGGCKVMEARQ